MDVSHDNPAKDIDLRAIVAVLRRQIRIIGYTSAAILGFAGLFLLAVTETFTATALILVDPSTKNVLLPQKSFANSAGQDNAHVDSQVEILRSDAVALDVINERGLIADDEFGARIPFREQIARTVGVANASPIDRDQALAKTLIRFRDATTIRRRGLTYLISVSTTSQSRQQAADLANGVAEAYIRRQIDAKIADTIVARNVLRQQMNGWTDVLAAYETKLDDLIDRNLGSPGATSSNPKLAALQARLTSAQYDRSRLSSGEAQARALMQQENWMGLAENLENDALGKLGNDRLAVLQQMTDPSTVDAITDLHQAMAEIDNQISTQTSAVLDGIGTSILGLDQNIAQIRNAMRREFAATDLPPQVLAEIYAVQQESSIARSQYQSLLSRMRDLETQAQIQVADSRVVSAALVPASASFPNRSLVLLAALAASMGLGLSLAFLKEYYIGGVTSTTQLAELLQVSVAAQVPQNPDKTGARISIADDIANKPLSVYSESNRKLKASIDQALRVRDVADGITSSETGKVILVTSALESEGKTSTALALARTYAQSGRKTLLIDADLRRPSVHRHFGFDPQGGFLEYLTDTLDPDSPSSFYARDPSSPLALIMGAERSEFPTDQLLCSVRFEMLLEQARSVYEIVVIDSSPLLPVVDARYISHHADCLALVVKWASTSQSDLRVAIQSLREAMQPNAVLIPVLSQIPDRSDRQSNSGYYSRYSAAI